VKIAGALLTAIHDDGLDVKMSLPESGEWKGSEVYLDALLGKAGLGPAIDGFALHDYHSTRDEKAKIAQYVAATYPATHLWMSEWTEMKSGRDTGMDSALTMAEVITDDLTVGGVTSWQFWIAVSKYDYRDGLIYTDSGTQQIIETKRLWALGNFSRFVRPGAVRVDATSSGGGLRVSAFRRDQPQTLIVVAVNSGAKPIAGALTIAGWPQSKGTFTVYETSETLSLERVADGRWPARVTIAPYSVTTLSVE
jgi:O-glycosyl hydrolase